MNGWQNISENNPQKAVGLRVDLSQSPTTTISYYNFAGKENGSGTLRIFNGIGVKTTALPGMTLQLNGDYGTQDIEESGESHWYSAALVAKAQPTPRMGISGRIERYVDPDQMIVVTGSDAGFRATMASVGIDVTPPGSGRAIWRSELRGTWSDDPVFPASSGAGLSNRNHVAVTSLTLTF